MEHVDVLRHEPQNLLVRRVACVYIEQGELVVKNRWDQKDYVPVIQNVIKDLQGTALERLHALEDAISTPYLDAVSIPDDGTDSTGENDVWPMNVEHFDDHLTKVKH